MRHIFCESKGQASPRLRPCLRSCWGPIMPLGGPSSAFPRVVTSPRAKESVGAGRMGLLEMVPLPGHSRGTWDPVILCPDSPS